jgi:hypothetical protein
MTVSGAQGAPFQDIEPFEPRPVQCGREFEFRHGGVGRLRDGGVAGEIVHDGGAYCYELERYIRVAD